MRRAGHRRAPDRAARRRATTATPPRRCAASDLLVAARRRAARWRRTSSWPSELEGCDVVDGERAVGRRARLLALPSCEVLEVARGDGAELLVPLVARRRPRGRRRRRGGSTSTSRSSAATPRPDADRRLHAVPRVVRLVPRPAPRRATRSRSGTTLECVNYRDYDAAVAAARSTTRRSAAAPGWCCASTSSTPRCARATARDPVELRARRRVIALDAGRAPARRRARRRARGRARADAAVRALRGLRRARSSSTSRPTRSRSAATCSPAASWRRWCVCDAVLRKLPGRARPRGQSARGGVLQRGARGRARVPALHAAGRVARLGGARGAAVGPPRADPRVAAASRAAARGGARRRRPRDALTRSATIAPPRRPGAALSLRHEHA